MNLQNVINPIIIRFVSNVKDMKIIT
jgi:hypothetical protein